MSSPGWGPETGAALASHPGVDKVAFTGSTGTGIAFGKAAIANMTRFSLELGGKSAQVVFDLGGFFVKPTVLTGIGPSMRAVREEIFGPVLSVMTFTDEDEAIEAANATEFGLAGAVWTKDIHRAHRVAAKFHTGTMWVDAYRVVAPDVPFGGIGYSGIGRENGLDAVNEFTETKAVWVELSRATRDPFTLG
jgi:acyl-CoA reductase-like NAD-dependent aldehyde dehydrogenase